MNPVRRRQEFYEGLQVGIDPRSQLCGAIANACQFPSVTCNDQFARSPYKQEIITVSRDVARIQQVQLSNQEPEVPVRGSVIVRKLHFQVGQRTATAVQQLDAEKLGRVRFFFKV